MPRPQRRGRRAPPTPGPVACLPLAAALALCLCAGAAGATSSPSLGAPRVFRPLSLSGMCRGVSGPVPCPSDVLSTFPRGGSMATRSTSSVDEMTDDDEEDDAQRLKEAAEEAKAAAALKKYLSDQHTLLNLRQTFLSESLARRGLPLATISGVSTADGDKPPEPADWDCAMATVEEPKSCLYSFDAEPNTKVVSPFGTTQWISLSALNRLRRTDPAKVEPMWHSRYAVLHSWFSDESEFSLMQHAGVKGFLLSNVLLDLGNGAMLRSLLAGALLAAIVIAIPALEYVANRALVSGALWTRWYSWHRIVHAALPFKLLIGQMAWKAAASSFAKIEGKVRDHIVDLECSMLEECVPLTVGPGAEMEEEEEEEIVEFDEPSEEAYEMSEEEDEDNLGTTSVSDTDLDDQSDW